MARLPRFVLPGQPQHVIQRGNNRAAIFCAEADYEVYLDKLKAVATKHHCEIHAYVLMTNHVHLLITPQREHEIVKTMQALGRYYIQPDYVPPSAGSTRSCDYAGNSLHPRRYSDAG